MRTPACGKCAPSSMLETIHENRCQVHVILLISTASARGDSGCVWRERARAIRFQKAARACSRPRAGQVAQQVVVSDSSDPTTVREAHACYIPATPQRRQRRRGAPPNPAVGTLPTTRATRRSGRGCGTQPGRTNSAACENTRSRRERTRHRLRMPPRKQQTNRRASEDPARTRPALSRRRCGSGSRAPFGSRFPSSS